MEQAFTLVATVLAAVPVGIGAAWFVTRGGEGLAAGFIAPRNDLGWPVGVQEEDIRPWAVEHLQVPGAPDESRPLETSVPLPEGIEGELIEGSVAPVPVERVHRH
jgi:hypothetical protein